MAQIVTCTLYQIMIWNCILHYNENNLMSLKSNLSAQTISVWAIYGARLAFAITIVLTPLRFRTVLLERPTPPVYQDFTDFLLYSSDISMLATIFLWSLSLAFVWRTIKFGPKFIWMPMIGLLIAGLVSLPASLDQPLTLYQLLRWIILFLFYLYIVNEVRSLTLIVVSIVAQVIFQSIYAVAQFYLQYSVGARSIGEHNLDPAIRGVSVVSDGSIRLLRAYGLAEHPNILAGCLAFSLILLLAVYIYYENKRMRVGLALVFLFGLLALFTTFSRSAWLAFLAGSAFLFVTSVIARGIQTLKPFMWLGLASVLMIAPFLWTYWDFVGTRFNLNDSFERIPIENQSLMVRGSLNKVALLTFWKHPIEGVGLGNSATAVGNYYGGVLGYAVPPHFAFLAVSMETGVLGAISYLWLLLAPWVVLVHKKISLSHNPYLLTAYALLLAVTLVGLFDIYPWLPPTGRLWHWLILGIWSVAYEMGVKRFEDLHLPK